MPRTHGYRAVISFGALKLFQCIMDQSILKDLNIRPVTRHLWTVNPNNVGFQNRDCDLVLSFKFVGVKVFVCLPTGKLLPITTEIDTMDGDEAVISNGAFIPVLPYDLLERIRKAQSNTY
jgi:hypothetical protein